MNNGLASAAQQLQSYGRGPDTMLAHISPDEAKLIDYMQGGRKTNPLTGLPEYGMLGKLLKGVARAAGAIGGFIVSGGNPLGAAAGAGIATKLTGGSWKQAGVGAALGGLGAGVGNLAGGAGFMGAGNAAGVAELAPHVASTGLAAGSAGGTLGGIGSAAGMVGGLGGLGAGLGGFMAEPRDQVTPPNMTPQPLDPGITYNANAAPTRMYNPYQGDMTKYGETGGGHSFFIPRPMPLNVDGVSLGDEHPMQTPDMYMARGGRAMSRAAAMGRISGPGDGSGMDDQIPAMLTKDEHVLDAEYVRLKGNGNVNKGHAAIEREKRKVRKAAGIPAPYKPAAARAKQRMKIVPKVANA